MKKFILFTLLGCPFLTNATTPKLTKIYGVYRNVTAPGSGTLFAVRCEAPFAKICLYRMTVADVSPITSENIVAIPNAWGLDETKNYIGIVNELGGIKFIQVQSSSITECNSEFIEILYY